MRRGVRMGGPGAGPTAPPRSATATATRPAIRPEHGVPPAGRLRRLPRRLVEIAVVVAGLLILAAAVLGGHVRNGGYHLDDWLALEMSHHITPGGIGDALSRQWDYAGFRPVSAAYRSLVWESPLGVHLGWNLAMAALVAVLMSAMLFALLRQLDVPFLDAGLIAALVLACPLASSTRLWVAASPASLNIALYLVGASLAVRGLRARTRREACAWHAAAATAYLASVLFAETTAALVVATGLLYWALAGFAAAAPRWIIDTSLAVLAVAYIATNNDLTPRASASLAALLDHARAMADEVPTIVARAFDPFGAHESIILVAIAVVAAGTSAWLVSPFAGERRELRRWLAMVVAGGVVVAAGYAAYIPANDYYRPLQAGIGNRINAVAAIGLVLLVYAVVRVAAHLLARSLRRGAGAASVAAVLAGAVLLWGYGDALRDDGAIWSEAYAHELRVLNFMSERIPAPPPGSTIYSVRQSQFYAPEVPLFVYWDLRGATKFWYGDHTLTAWGIPSGVPWHCGPDSMFPNFQAWGWTSEHGSRYGSAFIVDVLSGQSWQITDAASCQAMADTVAKLPLTPYVVRDPAAA